jgi:hypothetical protein
METASKKIGSARIHWFLGILCILAIITISVIVKQVSLTTGLVMGGITLILAPLILWFSETRRKHDDNIHYRVEGKKCYMDEDRNCTEHP